MSVCSISLSICVVRNMLLCVLSSCVARRISSYVLCLYMCCFSYEICLRVLCLYVYYVYVSTMSLCVQCQ